MKREPHLPADDASFSDALSALYQRWSQPLLRMLRSRLGTRADAEDAVQQVFVQMAASARLPQAGSEQAYLRQTASNIAIDGWRQRGRTRAIQTVSIESSETELTSVALGAEHDPAEHVQHRQRLDRLRQALNELPDRQRQAFMLHVIDGLTQQETAAQMGISLRMVSKHVSRGYAYCELRLQYGSVAQMQRLHVADDAQDDDPDPAPADCGEPARGIKP